MGGVVETEGLYRIFKEVLPKKTLLSWEPNLSNTWRMMRAEHSRPRPAIWKGQGQKKAIMVGA